MGRGGEKVKTNNSEYEVLITSGDEKALRLSTSDKSILVAWVYNDIEDRLERIECKVYGLKKVIIKKVMQNDE